MIIIADNHNLTDALLAWRYGNAAYYTSLAVLFLLGIATVFIRHDIFRAHWAFIALAIAVLPAAAERLTGIRLPWPMKFLITLALILHTAGGAFGLYFSLYPIYDKIAHLVASVAIAYLIFVVILVTGGMFRKHPGRLGICCGIFLCVMLLGLSWEYEELFIDLSTGTTYFVNPADSFFDMVFNIIGAGYVVLIVNAYLKSESFEHLYQRFIRWQGPEEQVSESPKDRSR
jgi:hypothetical protein